MNLAAKVISILFHPLFLPLYALPLYFSIENYQNLILNNADINFLSAIYSVMALVGVLFPILSMYVMIRTGLLSDFNAYNRVERKPVFFIVLLYYLMVYFMFRSWNSSLYHLLDPLLSFLSGGIYLLLICFVINHKWKISLHSTSISALTATFLAFSISMPSIENPIYLVIVNLVLLLIMGVVSSARLVLKAHQPHEVYMGILIGFTVEMIVVYFDLSI
jgi:hypothetical protein